MKAILSMDAYNRGYNPSIKFGSLPEDSDDSSGLQIGLATIYDKKGDTAAKNIGFYGIAYNYAGGKVISYRGTDDPTGLVGGGDIINGWIGSAGVQTTQAGMAFQFYKTVAGAGVDPRTPNISLTGHSLGGGLAGLVGALYGKSGILFDNMPFELAADNTQIVSDPVLAAAHGKTYDVNLRTLVYGSPTTTAWTPNFSNLLSTSVSGEALTPLRALQNDVPQAVLDLGDGTIDLVSGSDSVALHSMATLIIRMFADSDVVPSTWRTAAQYFWPVMYDDTFAGQFIGGRAAGTLSSTGKHADILRMVIAYSAIDEGTRIFGDTGIRAFYDDANNLGATVALSGGSQILKNYATDISRAFVQFAGELALGHVLKSAHPELLAGAVSVSNAAGNKSMTIDFADALWTTAGGGTMPSMIARANLFNHALSDRVLLSIDDYNGNYERQNMQSLWGNNTASAIDRVVFASLEGGTVDIADPTTPTGKATLFIGTAGADTVLDSSGNDMILTGNGDDTIKLSGGKDIVNGGDGYDTVDYSGMSTPLTISRNNWPALDVATNGGNDGLYGIEKVILGSGNDEVMSNPVDYSKHGTLFDMGEGIDRVYMNPYFESKDVLVTKDAVYTKDGNEFRNVEILSFNQSNAAFYNGASDVVVLALGHTYEGSPRCINYSQYNKSLQINTIKHYATDGVDTDSGIGRSIVGTDHGDVVTIDDETSFWSGRGNDFVTIYDAPIGVSQGDYIYSGGHDVIDIKQVVNPHFRVQDLSYSLAVAAA